MVPAGFDSRPGRFGPPPRAVLAALPGLAAALWWALPRLPGLSCPFDMGAPMRNYVSGHRADTPQDFAELALGTPPELWLGVDGESAEERAARLDAARDILADPEYQDLPDALIR